LKSIILHIITGQTASGKSAVAFEIAKQTGTEIICIDSMKIYRGMDIGTAKPTPRERETVRYHLLDIAQPREDFSTAKFVKHVQAAIADINSRKLPVLLEGGTPLYLKAITEGIFKGPPRDPVMRAKLKERAALEGPESLHKELSSIDPDAAKRIAKQDIRRIIRALEVYYKTGRPISELQTQFGERCAKYDRRIAALRHEREYLRRRIEERIDRMFKDGLVEEARTLEGWNPGKTASQAIGYLEARKLAAGEITEDEAKSEIRRRTWQLARRQMTWLRSFPDIVFYDVPPGEEPAATAKAVRAILRLKQNEEMA